MNQSPFRSAPLALIFTLAALLLPQVTLAQLMQPQPAAPVDGEIDSIVALVDESVILRSELDAAIGNIVIVAVAAIGGAGGPCVVAVRAEAVVAAAVPVAVAVDHRDARALVATTVPLRLVPSRVELLIQHLTAAVEDARTVKAEG